MYRRALTESKLCTAAGSGQLLVPEAQNSYAFAMRCRMPVLFWVVTSGLVGACLAACGDGIDGLVDGGPAAHLKVAVIVPVGEPVVLDGSASTDPEGLALTYTFVTGVSAPTTQSNPQTEVTFATPGSVAVRLTVTDPAGNQGTVEHMVTARQEYPPTPDFCAVDGDCVVGDECQLGVCYYNR